jgi:hypothetical protein
LTVAPAQQRRLGIPQRLQLRQTPSVAFAVEPNAAAAAATAWGTSAAPHVRDAVGQRVQQPAAEPQHGGPNGGVLPRLGGRAGAAAATGGSGEGGGQRRQHNVGALGRRGGGAATAEGAGVQLTWQQPQRDDERQRARLLQ